MPKILLATTTVTALMGIGDLATAQTTMKLCHPHHEPGQGAIPPGDMPTVQSQRAPHNTTPATGSSMAAAKIMHGDTNIAYLGKSPWDFAAAMIPRHRHGAGANERQRSGIADSGYRCHLGAAK